MAGGQRVTDGRTKALSFVWLVEALTLATVMLVPFLALCGVLIYQDPTPRTLVPVGLLAIGGLLAGSMVLRRAIERESRVRNGDFRLRGLLNDAPEGIIVFDVERRQRVYGNATIERLFGRPVSSVLEGGANDLCPPFQDNGEASELAGARLIERALTGEQVRATWRFKRQNGEEFPATVVLTRLPGPHQVVRIGITDLSHERSLERSRSQAEVRVRTLVDHAPEGVMLVNRSDLIVSYANRAAGRIIGLDAGLLVGHSIIAAAVNPQPDGSTPQNLLMAMEREALSGLESTRRWLLRRIDGSLIHTEVRALLLPGDGDVFRVSVIDLTGQLALEENAARAEASLRASEARFRHLAQISTDWYWEIGLDDRFSLVDGGSADDRQLMAQLVGRAPSEIRRFTPLDIDWEQARALRERREPYRQLLQFSVPDAPAHSARILEIVADPMWDNERRYLGYRGVARDITDRHNAQLRQRESEAAARRLAVENEAAAKRFELIVRSMPVAFMVLDSMHRITLWNPEAERVFGYAEGDVIGKTPFELIVPPDQTLSATKRLTTISQGVEFLSGIHQNRTRSGERIHCEWRNARIADADGRFAGSIGMALDITARLDAEREIRDSAVHFRRLTELASDYEWETDAEYRFVQQASSGFHAVRNTTIGRRPWELPYAHPVNMTWEVHRAQIESRKPFSSLVIETRDPDDRRHYRMLSGEPKFDDQGRFAGYRGIGTDVSRSHRENLRRSGEVRLFEALSRGESLVRLMTILCETMEALTERPSRASVLLVTNGRLQHLAAPRLPDDYNQAIDGLEIGPTAGCCAAAAALGETVVAEDLQTHPNWIPYRDLATAAGVRSCWSTPVYAMDGTVIATFAVYGDSPATPAPADRDITDSAARLAALVIERVRAAEALRESEDRMRRLVTLSSDWEWEQDEQFRFTRLRAWREENQQLMTTMLGLTRWEIPNLRPVDFSWDEHRRVLESREPFTHTVFERTTPAGRRHYWAARGEPVLDESGNFKGYRGVGVDITERYRTDLMRIGERAFFEGMAQGRSLRELAKVLTDTMTGVLEVAGAVIIKEVDLGQLRTLAFSGTPPGWEKFIDTPADIGQDATSCGEAVRSRQSVVYADVRTEARCASIRTDLIEAGILSSWSIPVTDRAGHTLATLCVVYPHPAEPSAVDREYLEVAGRLAGFVIERLRATESARESAERYRNLVEQSQDGVLIHEWGTIEYANPAFVRMIGAGSMDALVGLNAMKLFTKESQTRSRERLARLRDHGEPQSFAEMELQRLSGGVIEVEVAASVVESHGRRLVQTQYRDISARKWTEREILKLNHELEQRVEQRTEELTALNRELEAFSYSVAHDLRAPLRAIDGFSQLLKVDLGASIGPDALRDVDAISNSARKMAELINGLLDFARYGRGNLSGQRVDTQAMVASVVEDVGRGRKVEFVVGSLKDVHGDPVMLHQVWANLIGNAVKFSGKRERPCVMIDCKTLQNECQFSVSDNGEGFDMAYADKLFGVFQRLHSSEEFEGTGVGLAIVKRIVERHGGRIWAESVPGGGAVFRFTLPPHELTSVDAMAIQVH